MRINIQKLHDVALTIRFNKLHDPNSPLIPCPRCRSSDDVVISRQDLLVELPETPEISIQTERTCEWCGWKQTSAVSYHDGELN